MDAGTDSFEWLVDRVLDAATEVHRTLGPGLLESAYEAALAFELSRVGLEFQRQVAVPVIYKGGSIGTGFRADFVVADQLLLELKSVDDVIPLHFKQVATYLRFLRLRRGYLLNFNKSLMKEGIRRVTVGPRSPSAHV